jgi:hypothetical protein
MSEMSPEPNLSQLEITDEFRHDVALEMMRQSISSQQVRATAEIIKNTTFDELTPEIWARIVHNMDYPLGHIMHYHEQTVRVSAGLIGNEEFEEFVKNNHFGHITPPPEPPS